MSNSNINIKKTSKFFLAILGALMAVTSLSTDIYLPAMPQMHVDLQGNIELTITGFLLGFSIAQIIWGPISDKFGRLLPLTLGLSLFIIGSVGCALSQTITQIVFWRIIQAFGACTAPMLSRAMVRDMFGLTKSAEMLSTLMIIMAIAPIFGPLLGGQLLKISSWHSIFWLLAGVGIIMLVSIIWLPETQPKEKRPKISMREAFAKYKLLITNHKFMKYTLCVTFFYVGAYAFIAGSPSVYISYYKVAPEDYGWLFALNILGIISLNFANRILVKHFSLDLLLKVATTIAMISGFVLVIFVKHDIGGIYGVIVPVFFFFSMNGIIAATATAAALDGVPQMAGAASALLGALQYGSGILSSLLLAYFSDGKPWTMSWIILVSALASASIVLVRFKRLKPLVLIIKK